MSIRGRFSDKLRYMRKVYEYEFSDDEVSYSARGLFYTQLLTPLLMVGTVNLIDSSLCLAIKVFIRHRYVNSVKINQVLHIVKP